MNRVFTFSRALQYKTIIMWYIFQNLSKYTQELKPKGKIWDVFCEFKAWSCSALFIADWARTCFRYLTFKETKIIEYFLINLGCNTLHSGPWFNIKMSSLQYRKSHCGDKTVVRSSYLHNGISYTGKMTSLYWIRPLDISRYLFWKQKKCTEAHPKGRGMGCIS